MDQLNMSFMDNDTSVIANRYYNEILSLLEVSNLGYDLSQIQVEHRDPESSDAYDTILMFKRPCFHIKGKKTKHIYLHPSFARLLEKAGYSFEPATSARWARIATDSFVGFPEISEMVEELYEDCLRDSDTFGCCGSYLACSDAGHCIKTDIMFAGKCAYRQNLKAGKIFYGKNKNIRKLCAGKHPCTQFFIALLTLALKFYGILNCSLLLCAGQSPWYWLLPSVQR